MAMGDLKYTRGRREREHKREKGETLGTGARSLTRAQRGKRKRRQSVCACDAL